MPKTLDSIIRQTQAQQAQVQGWQQQQTQTVEEQARETEEAIKKRASEIEAQAQEAKEAVRTERQKETARQVLKKKVPKTKEYETIVSDIEKQRKEALVEAEKAKKEVEKSKQEVLSEIKEAAERASAEVAEANREAIKQYNEIRKENIELDTGEWINKVEYSKLNTSDQKLLKRVGIDEFNKVKEQQLKNLKAKYIEVGDGELIERQLYNSLSQTDKIYIKEYGVNKFNEYKQKQIEKDTVKLSTGELINKDIFNKLNKSEQELLSELGTEGYNKHNADILYNQYKDLAKETGETVAPRSFWDTISDKDAYINKIIGKHYTETKTGELIKNDILRDLPSDEQTILIREGLDALEEYQDNKYITTKYGETLEKASFHSLPFESQVMIDNRGLEYYNNHVEKNYHQLKTGELVGKDFYNNLVPSQQAELNSMGYDEFIENNYVTLSNGDKVPKKSHRDITGTDIVGFDDMSKDNQQSLMELGVKGYNDLKQKDFDKEMKKYHELDNGELILKDEYNALSSENKRLINKVGITQFNVIQDKIVQDYIAKQSPEAQEWIAKHGIDDFNRWLEKADKETNERAFVITQQLGIIPENAQFVGRNNKGEFEYIEKPDAVNLGKIDWDNLTSKDFVGIVIAASGNDLKKHGDWRNPSFLKWYNKQTPEHRKLLSKLSKKAAFEHYVDIASFVFPPAQALKADVKLSDISGADWAIGAANLALIAVVPALSAMGKLAASAGKIATIGKAASVTGKVIQFGAVAAYPAVTAIEWKKMTPTQQSVALALNIAIIGAVYGKSIISGLKILGKRQGGKLSETAVIINKMSKAVKAGNVARVKALAEQLKSISAEMRATNPMEARILEEQADFFIKNAKLIAKHSAKLSVDSAKLLRQINKEIARDVKIKEFGSGGQVSKLPKEMFKRAEIKPAPAKLPTRVKVKELPAKTKEQTDRFLKMRTQQWAESQASLSQAQKLGLIQKVQRITPSAPRTLAAGEAETASANLLSQIAKEAGIKVSVQRIIEKKLAEVAQRALKASRQVTGDATGFVRVPKPNLKPAQWKPTLITKLSKADIEKLITQWAKMSPSKALQQMLEANLVTVALASNAKAVIKIISKASVKLQTRVKSAVSTKLREAIEQATRTDVSSKTRTNNIIKVGTLAKSNVKAATKALTRLETQAKSLVRTSAKTQATTKALTQAQVKTEALTKTQAITRAATKAVTRTTTKADTKTQIKTKVQQAVQQEIAQITSPKVQEAVKAKTAEIVGAVTARVGRGAKVVRAGRVPPPPIIELSTGERRPMTPDEIKGAVAWKQGFIYKMIYPPYTDVQNSRTPYPGIRTVKGVRSAYETIVRLKGRIPARLAYDMGIMDIFIETPRGGKGKPKIRFKRDIKQQTKHSGLKVAKV